MEAQKSLWSKGADFLKTYASKSAIKKAAPLLLAQLGVKASSFYVWVTASAIKLFVNYIEPVLREKGYIAEVVKWAKSKMPMLEQNKKDIPVDEKVKNESDFLNGTDTK